MYSVSSTRYPRLARYLSLLPGGFTAHPECQIRADFAAAVQKEHPGLWTDPGLQPSMREILSRPWTESEWLPVVVISTQSFILQDRLGLSDDDLVERSMQHTIKMLDQTLNRAIMRVLSPRILFMGAAWRWQTFHRGIDVVLLKGDRESQRVKMTSPPNLLSTVAIRYYGALFKLSVERTGGTRAEVQIERPAPGEVQFALRWTLPA